MIDNTELGVEIALSFPNKQINKKWECFRKQFTSFHKENNEGLSEN